MKRILISELWVILLAIVGLSLFSCDKYEKVPALHECVLMELPWRAHADGGAVTLRPLRTGNQNLGDSENNMALFVNMGLQTETIKIQVLMADELNQDMELNLNFQVIEGQSVQLVLNYLSQYQKIKGKSWAYQVDLSDIFRINILPSFDMVSRQVASAYKSSSIPREELKDEILRQLKARLAKIRKPKIAVDNQGKVVYANYNARLRLSGGDEIAITDVIDIVSVDIGAMPAPEPVQQVIQEIETANADLKTAMTEKEQALIQREIDLTEAKHVAAANRKITENWTPELRIYRFQKLLKDTIPIAKNCRIYYLPAGANIMVGAIGSPPNISK
ncbi:MAG: hypothetical protein ACE5PV_04315 [Candidatus Poribacteria bacterium]